MYCKFENGNLRGILSIAVLAGLMIFSTPGVGQQPQSEQVASDDDLVLAIERQYRRDSAVPLRDVDIHVEDGVVALSGDVETLMARQQAEDLAGVVRGVRSVINRISLVPTGRSPQRLESDIRDALRADPLAEAYEITVDANETARVVLTGAVDSWAEKDQVGKIVMTVPGVLELNNHLIVEETAAPRGPSEIAEEVESRLRWDVRVDDSLIDVLALDGGRVVLSGTVGSLAEKQHAERLAHITGVREVLSDQLTVEPWARNENLRRSSTMRPTDEEIHDAVRTALAYDPRVLREHIAVVVRNGVVDLSGYVENLNAKRSAGQDAANTIGVLSVRNELELQAGLRDDEAIAQLIRNALRGYGLTDEENNIDVAVDQGHVTLEGDVGSAYVHWQAEEVAMVVRGAITVDNQMTINGQIPVLLTRLYSFTPELDRMVAADRAALPTDREIYEEVLSELFWSPFVDSDDISVDVDAGVVTLTGEVSSDREYQAAQLNAFQGGAQSVENNLTVSR